MGDGRSTDNYLISRWEMGDSDPCFPPWPGIASVVLFGSETNAETPERQIVQPSKTNTVAVPATINVWAQLSENNYKKIT